ncbi:MAG: alpha-hydroxy-acid oxidizing protein [Alphaproteobacteria bacterium]|nr:alpha-hydroxy-acid oxidizing protein [Alphaproteobacteria bacterium]
MTAGWQRRGYNVACMRALARTALPRPVFDFADGGAEDERTLRGNEAAFADLALLPRPMNGPATRDLSVDLFGTTLALPVLIGPTGLAGLFWPDAERLAARAAAAAGTAYCLSHGSVCTLEKLAELGTAPRWMQVFVYNDREFMRALIARAAAAGYHALVLTIDNQLLGNRERDVRNGFTIPPRFGPGEVVGMALKLPWLRRMYRELPRITFGNYVRPGVTEDISRMAARMAHLLDPALNWADVDEIRQLWKGPLLLKGVLHPAEAAEAMARGVDGLIVSNHGGRQLDGAVTSLAALPGVLEVVGGRVPVLIDGGVRRGADVVKALALGATACLIGRPALWGVSVAGEAGVAHVLDIFRREIDRAMGLVGAARIADLGPDLLFRGNAPCPIFPSSTVTSISMTSPVSAIVG